MNDDEIFDILKENSNEEYLSEFLKELFLLELSGTGDWKKTYDIIIDEYINKL